jgi:hypothetical protein
MGPRPRASLTGTKYDPAKRAVLSRSFAISTMHVCPWRGDRAAAVIRLPCNITVQCGQVGKWSVGE